MKHSLRRIVNYNLHCVFKWHQNSFYISLLLCPLLEDMALLEPPTWRGTRWRNWTSCPTTWSSTWSSPPSPPVCWCLRKTSGPSLWNQTSGYLHLYIYIYACQIHICPFSLHFHMFFLALLWHWYHYLFSTDRENTSCALTRWTVPQTSTVSSRLEQFSPSTKRLATMIPACWFKTLTFLSATCFV